MYCCIVLDKANALVKLSRLCFTMDSNGSITAIISSRYSNSELTIPFILEVWIQADKILPSMCFYAGRVDNIFPNI
jgi:hypothetical protein